MNEINPEMQNQVEALAKMCGQAMEGQDVDLVDNSRPIVDSLVTGGYHRLSDVPLANRVEEVAVDQFEELAIHRRAQLRSYCEKLQDQYDERQRWHASEPEEHQPSKAANISSGTDA